jgi:hypothetical protein
LIVVASGCTTAGTTNTARSSTEQLLISNAIDQSLDKIDFSPFAERTVYVDEKYVDCTDKNYVVASVRHRIARAGGLLVAAPDEARILVELRNGAVGTETSESFLGIPEIVLPGMLTLPEIQLANRTRQHGMAKIGLIAIDTETRQALGDGGMTTARSDNANWFFMGIGPFQRGTLRKELKESLASQPSPGVTPVPHKVAFRNPASTVNALSEVRLTSQETATDAAAETPQNLEPRRLQQ